MIKRVDEKLHLAESNKRTREEGYYYTETCKRAKLTLIDPAATDCQQGIASKDAAKSVDEPLNVGELPTSLRKPGGGFTVFEPMPDLTAYNAPVHNQINWLVWNPDGGLDNFETSKPHVQLF